MQSCNLSTAYNISPFRRNDRGEIRDDRGEIFKALIEALRSKLRRIFDSYGTASFGIRSLTPQQAAGNALATEFYGGSVK